MSRLREVKSDIGAAFDGWLEYLQTDNAYSRYDHLPADKQFASMRRDREKAATNKARVLAEIDRLAKERNRFRDALQAIVDYKPSRQGTDAFLEIAHHCQTTARAALASHKGGVS